MWFPHRETSGSVTSSWIDNVVSAQGDFGFCHLLLLTVGTDLLETRLINSVGSQHGQLVSHGYCGTWRELGCVICFEVVVPAHDVVPVGAVDVEVLVDVLVLALLQLVVVVGVEVVGNLVSISGDRLLKATLQPMVQ